MLDVDGYIERTVFTWRTHTWSCWYNSTGYIRGHPSRRRKNTQEKKPGSLRTKVCTISINIDKTCIRPLLPSAFLGHRYSQHTSIQCTSIPDSNQITSEGEVLCGFIKRLVGDRTSKTGTIRRACRRCPCIVPIIGRAHNLPPIKHVPQQASLP